MLKQAQDSIVNRLLPLQVAHQVRVGALSAAHLGQPVTASQLWVLWRESSFEESMVQGRPVQRRQLDFQVILRFVNLVTHDQAFPIMAAVLDALTGWVPDGCYAPMRCISERFVEQAPDSGIWVFSQLFRTSALYKGGYEQR